MKKSQVNTRYAHIIGNQTLFGKEVTIAIQGFLTGVPKEEIVRSVESLLDLDLGRRREHQVRELQGSLKVPKMEFFIKLKFEI